MPCSDIMKIPLGSKLPNIFKMFADMDECLDDGQVSEVKSRLVVFSVERKLKL